jgi:hypothetical protein
MSKGSPKFWATFGIFKKPPKESIHPLGKITPNLVTLSVGS